MTPPNQYQECLDVFYALGGEAPEVLQGVSERITDGCREFLRLQFTTKCLCVTANTLDDTIRVRCEDTPPLDGSVWTRLDSEEPWQALIGSEFGWGWLTINQQGYGDGILLSFNGIVPTIMLAVVASSITIHRISLTNQGTKAPCETNAS